MHPYRVAGLILGALAFLFGGFMVLGFLLPGGWEAEATIEVPAPPSEVFPFLNGAVGWEAWTPSPESGTEYFGPENGVGSGRRWNDPGYGQGEFVILDSWRDRSVSYAVEVEDGAIEIRGRIELDRNTRGTLISWTEAGDFGWNPLLGYLANRMSELQSAQLTASLESLRGLVKAGVRSQND